VRPCAHLVDQPAQQPRQGVHSVPEGAQIEREATRSARRSRAAPPHLVGGNRVAVCVTGMRARLLPASLLTQLVVQNANWQFDLIYVLAAEQGVYYSTRYDSRTTRGNESTPSRPQHEAAPFGSLNEVELSHAIEAEARFAHRHNDASSALANVGVHVLNFSQARSMAAWRRELGLPSCARLDRIYKYEQIEDRLLNMYAHHVKCAAKILALEQAHGAQYDLVISTREDAHLLQPLLLHPLLASANSSTPHNSGKPHDSSKPHADSSKPHADSSKPHADSSKPHADSSSKAHEEACDLYAKDCLTWGADGMPGLNMRMQIYRRHAGLRMLSSRLTFFASLYAERTKIKNPETYEWAQAARLGLRVCPRPPSLIPVVVARHTRDGAYCFPRDELEDRGAKHHAACLPPLEPMQPDPMANMCPEAPRKSWRWPWQPQVFRLRC